MAWHHQVQFRTHDDLIVDVDEGMLEILTHLKWLGVKSLYSCQGGVYKHQHLKRKINDQAYLLVRTRGAKRLERKIRRGYNRGLYSRRTMEIIGNFIQGKREFEASLFVDTEPQYRMFSFIRRYGNKKSQWLVERSIDNLWGFRTTYRWPHEYNDWVRDALAEIASSQKLHGL